jgi:ketosteroid isomerase-like protein
MKLAGILCAIALATVAHDATATAPHPSLPPALAKAVAAFDRAQMEGDGAALQRLLADDYVLFNSRALVEDKADFIHDYTAPGYSLKPFTIEDEVVRYWPGGAVLGGVVTLEGTSEGKPFKVRLRFADIWRQRDGRWQVIFTEATRAPWPGRAP